MAAARSEFGGLSYDVLGLRGRALTGAAPEQREAFTLFAIEGFTVEEIAQVSKQEPAQVKKSIKAARDLVDHKLPNDNALKRHLLNSSRVA